MLNHKAALKHLKTDPKLKQLIQRYGELNYSPPTDRFENLVSTIIGQQLSNKAADTIFNRFLNQLPSKQVTPQNVLNIPDVTLRSSGTSWAKIRAIKDLSQKVIDGVVSLASLDTMSDNEVIAHLTQVIGIGPWTAQMKLMFVLHRPDVFPVDDRGIQNAMIKLYHLKDDTRLRVKMTEISQKWKPYRTVACWYLWKSLDNV